MASDMIHLSFPGTVEDSWTSPTDQQRENETSVLVTNLPYSADEFLHKESRSLSEYFAAFCGEVKYVRLLCPEGTFRGRAKVRFMYKEGAAAALALKNPMYGMKPIRVRSCLAAAAFHSFKYHQPPSANPSSSSFSQVKRMEVRYLEPEDELKRFVEDMHQNGFYNWVIYGGVALNLEDENDVASKGLTAAEADELFNDAIIAASTASSCGPPIPLQPWEMQKLLAVTEQVVSALHDGRYSHDYGEILLQNIQPWCGANEWAKEEEARLVSFVSVDDERSRRALLHHLEGSILVTLRECLKELNRGHVSGVMNDGSSSQPSNSLAADGHSCADRLDKKEAEELECALAASLEDLADDVSISSNKAAVCSGLVGDDSCSDVSCDDWESEAEDDVEPEMTAQEEQGRVKEETKTHGCNVHNCGSAYSSGHEAGIIQCTHPCDVSGTACCCCAVRKPRPGVMPGLQMWWRENGNIGCPFATSDRWRFLCGQCERNHKDSHLGVRLPLPFGGAVVQCFSDDSSDNDQRLEEFVKLSVDDWSDGSWEKISTLSAGSSWVIAS